MLRLRQQRVIHKTFMYHKSRGAKFSTVLSSFVIIISDLYHLPAYGKIKKKLETCRET